MFNFNSSLVVVFILASLRSITGATNINYINDSTINDIDFYVQEWEINSKSGKSNYNLNFLQIFEWDTEIGSSLGLWWHIGQYYLPS